MLISSCRFLLGSLETCCYCLYCYFFFFKQKTAYDMRISDWSSDVCSSDLRGCRARSRAAQHLLRVGADADLGERNIGGARRAQDEGRGQMRDVGTLRLQAFERQAVADIGAAGGQRHRHGGDALARGHRDLGARGRSEEHTSELQSLMRNQYAVF